jgi:HPt (histidine-containing phosphotransfer) domain-containing protein
VPERQATTRAEAKEQDAAGQAPRKYRASIARAPIVDPARLQETAGNPESWKFEDFVRTFLLMLPYRVEKVHQALTAGNWEEGRLAAQSLSWSAAMAGACRLELIAGLIDTDLGSGRNSRARETARLLGVTATELEAALTLLNAG